MAKKSLDSITNRFHYRLVLDYEDETYPMDIIFVNDRSVFLKTYKKFVKYWSDRISGILIQTKNKFVLPVRGIIKGHRPLAKKGEDLDFESNEWLLEVEIENKEEIPSEWISFSMAEENSDPNLIPPIEDL